MAYYTNFDEKEILNDAGETDVWDSKFDFSSDGKGKLSEGKKGYGELTYANKSIIALHDVDYYDLDYLDTGKYTATVKDHVWDVSNDDGGSVDTFSVVDGFNQSVGELDSISDTISFTVESSFSKYFVKIEGEGFLTNNKDAQYSVVYNKVGELNNPATFSNPDITGIHQVGQTLTASISYSDTDGTLSASPLYYWYSFDGNSFEEIESNSGSYTIREEDIGLQVVFKMKFQDDEGNWEESSGYESNYTLITAAVSNNAPIGAVTITGTVVEDQTLTAVTSALSDADELGSFSYQWIRAGSDISGATSSTYALVQADVGNAISVKVSYTDGEGTAETVTSVASQSVIAASNEAVFTNQAITGSYQVGETLTADVNYSDPNGTTGAVTDYFWYNFDGTSYTFRDYELTGTYTIQDIDEGDSIAVFFSFQDDAGNWEYSDYYSTFETVIAASTSDTINISNITITEDTVISEDTIWSGNNVIKGKVTILEGVVLTISTDSTTISEGNITIIGTLVLKGSLENTGTIYISGSMVTQGQLVNTGTLSYGEVIDSSDAESTDTSNDDILNGTSGIDEISAGKGADVVYALAGNDTITLTGNTTHDGKFAHNVGSTVQIATDAKIDLTGKVKLETVIDGGADADTINLGSGNDAFFLHDSFSGFHSSLTLATDSHTGGASTQRIMNVETINGLDGDDIIDLTSPDYSLAGQVITINGGTGNDVIWGSDATETLIGGDGNDILFGGSGNDTLTGGSGADTFEFTVTAGSDTITDYSKSDGDILKIYRRDQYEGDQEATISAGVVTFGSVTIDLGDTSLTSLDVLNVEYAII